MINTAICDSSQAELKTTGLMIQNWMKHSGVKGKIESYLSSVTLAEEVKHGARFDLFIMAVVMPKLDGIALGKLIQKTLPNAEIIYITNSREYALEAFENKALQYLIKPVQEEQMIDALNQAQTLIKISQAKEIINIKSKTGLCTVRIPEIMYVENVLRTPYYHLENGVTIQGLVNRGTFDQAIAPISTLPGFVSPHKSYWVNMAYIRVVVSGKLMLSNREELPISRARAAALNRRYAKYLEQVGVPKI